MITLFFKKGKRIIVNYDIVLEVANLFKVNVNVKTFIGGKKWENDFLDIQKTTVLFTPPGGISFPALFMNEKSVLIRPQVWNDATDSPMRYESDMWINIAQFLYLDYTIEKKDIVGPTNGRDLHWTDIRIIPERLIKIFCEALFHAERVNNWKHSFDSKPCKNINMERNVF